MGAPTTNRHGQNDVLDLGYPKNALLGSKQAARIFFSMDLAQSGVNPPNNHASFASAWPVLGAKCFVQVLVPRAKYQGCNRAAELYPIVAKRP